MKKYVQNIWVRLLACILCTVSLLGTVIAFAGMFFFAAYPDKNAILKEGNETLMRNYGLYASDYLHTLEEDGFFDDINLYITIEKLDYLSEVDTEPTVTKEYSNMPEGMEPTYYMEGVYVSSNKHYNTKSLLLALDAYYYPEYDDYMVSTPIEGYVFDSNTGIFYYQTPIGYFKADYIYVSKDGRSYDYRLTVIDGKERYFNSYYALALDTTEYAEWDWVSISNKKMGITETFGGNLIQLVTDSATIESDIRVENYYAEDYAIHYVSDKVTTYNISMAVADTLTHHDLFYEYQNLIDEIYYFQEDVVGILWGCIILFILSLVLLVVSAPEEKEKLRFFHKIPVVIFTGATILIEVILFWLIVLFLQVTFNNNMAISVVNFATSILNMVMVMLFVAFVYLANIITRIKTKSFYRYSEFYYISRPLLFVYRFAKEHTPLFWKGAGLLLGLSFIEFLLLTINQWEPDNLFICFFIGKLIEIPIVLYVLYQLHQLWQGAKKVASGNLSQPIDTSKMIWEFKKHGENINKVRDGIAIAVEDQMKSERFKTELITNVSHDIKTPLTSIINYVDLIKKEEITDETLCEYVDVLDRQSSRLKKLIEDLMEASKASTGNLEVELQECDAEVLLTQVIGEFEDKLAANDLEVIVNKPEEPVMVMADGRHMWRVLDNLLNNVCKYSQENTRVYVSLEKEEQMAVITFKNISKAALNIPSDQLMQRFVRGDSSRHTEGSGLGLSIAQSLTELMNGTLKLDIDGDLFKVTLKFKAI